MAVGSATDNQSIIDQINGKKTEKTQTTMEEAQDRFLTLLVTQLKNQDPMNPMDNSQMTSQLAQMSTVTGIEKLNATLNGLVNSMGDTQAIQAAAMIGKNVLVPGSGLSLVEGAAFGGANLAAGASNVQVTIKNAAGTVVQIQDLGEQKAGNVIFAWDGKDSEGAQLPDGAYKFELTAKQGNNEVKVDALQVGMVSALVRSGSGFLLDLGALGTIDFSKVQQIL